MKIERLDPGVFVGGEGAAEVGAELLELLRREAPLAPRKRVRFNAHAGADSPIQEMIIALAFGSYIAPHWHRGKTESYHLVEGEVSIVLFEDDGELQQVVRLGASKDRILFYRNDQLLYHCLVVESDVAILHETTCGPFIPRQTVFADWAPSTEGRDAEEYLAKLRRRIQAFS